MIAKDASTSFVFDEKIPVGCRAAPLPPRRRPGRCVGSRQRAGEPAGVPAARWRLHRSATGARGGGTPRCHAAAFGGRTRPVPRLRCAVRPLPSLPGAARRAAAGPGGPRDRAAGGDGAARPGEARLLHEGALRVAGAVPRRMRDGHRLRGWDGKGHAWATCQKVPTKRSRKVAILQYGHISN